MTAALVPGAANSSHSPGPELMTSVPYPSRAARPKGTSRERASSPFVDASTRTLARGVQSVIFSSAALRRALISQPCSTVIGGTGAMGLRAMGAVSTTLTCPFGVVVGVVRRDGGRYAFSVGQLHGDLCPRCGEVRGDEAQADRTPQRGRHAARGYSAHDVTLLFHDLARFGGNQRAVVRLQSDEPKADVALALPLQLGLAGEVVFVQLDHKAETHIVGSCEPVGVLAHDEVALLQAQDALCLDAEGQDSQVRAALYERLPHVQPGGCGHVDLVAELAGEADPPHKATVDAGYARLANPQIGEDFRRKIHALGHPQEQFAGSGAGDVDAGIGRGHRMDVDTPFRLRGLQPVFDPLPHASGAGGGRRRNVSLRTQAAGHAVVEDHAVLEAHHAVAYRAHVEVVPPVDVQVIQQSWHVGTAQVELAQGSNVYDADVFTDVSDLGGGIPVVVGPDPGARHQRLRPVALVPGLHRRVPHRLEDASGQGPQGDRTIRGPPHGGPRLSDGATRGLSHNSHGVDGLEFALGRAHGHRG